MKRFKATHLYFTCLLLPAALSGFASPPPAAGPPEMIALVKESSTTLRLHFNEIVTIPGTYNNEFSLIDCKGNSFAVSAIADDIANDMSILLTTDDLSTSQGDLTLTFFNQNNPILDVDSNPLGTDGIGVELLESSKFDVSASTYDSKFYTITENSDPRAFTFNSDGTKIYVLGVNTDATIYEYTLSTPYEVQTMSYTGVSLSVGQSGTVTNPLHVEFTPDGSRLFVSSFTQFSIAEYQLSTNFDLNTASLITNHSVSLSLTCFQFNGDGSKVYIMDISFDRIGEYSLGTPYDLATRAFSANAFLSLSMPIPVSFSFNNDGTKLFALERNIEQVEQYSLAVPYDLASVSYDGTAERKNVNLVGQAGGMGFSNDGSEMYVIGTATNKSIFQFSVSDNDGPQLDQILLKSNTEIDVLYDETVSALGSNPSNFTVLKDGAALTIDQVSDPNPGDQSITLTLNAATTLAGVTTSVQVTYADAGGNGEITDSLCNAAEDDAVGITLALESQAPGLVAATIQDSQTILLTFDEAIQTTGNNASNFTITDCRVISYTAQAIKDETPGDNLLELLVDDLTYRSGDLSIDYTDPGNDAIFDGFLNPLANLTTTITSSISDFILPTMTGLSKNSPTEVTVTFSENVSVYEQFPTSFTVSDGSTLYSPSAILDGTQGDSSIKLSFGSPIASSSELTVTYNNGSGNNEIADFSCNNLASDPTGITVSLEAIAPILRIVQVESTTELSLHFDEPVQLSSGVSGSNFVLTDCDATAFNVTAVADGASNDNIITLTVDDLTSANGELSLQISTNNFELTDLSGNTMAGNSVTFPVTNSFNLTKAVFTGSSEQFNFSTEDTFPISMAFDGSGTSMYMVGNDNKVIHRYQLATAYDVSTATLTTDNLDVSNQSATPLFIGFNPTGTRLYLTGVPPSGTTWVSQFDLSIGYDITTAVFAGSLDTNTTEGEDIPTGLAFNANGSKLLVIGAQLDMVLEYDLSISYDISSATYAGNTETLDVAGPSGGVPVSMVFDDSGLVMWVMSNNNSEVVKYLLDSPFDVSTGTFAGTSQTLSFSQDSDPRRLVLNSDGSQAFILGAEFDNVYEFELVDLQGPSLQNITLINNTTIELTFDEPVKAAGSFPGDFSVTDLAGLGSSFAVNAITDATAGDEILRLTVNDLSSASGDIQVAYDNLNNEIADLNCNDMAADPTGISIDLDMTAPTLTNAVLDNNTQISITFSEPVQTNGGNPTDFTVTDGAGNTYNVTTQADGVAQDNTIVLTIADLSNAVGDLTVSYTNNNQEVRDFGNNELATDSQGVAIDLDQTPPTIVSAAYPSGFSVVLTFSEIVQTNEGNPSDFNFRDAVGNFVTIGSQVDDTPLDNEIVLLPSSSFTGAIGDLFIEYINNNDEVTDFGGNSLQSTTTDIEIDIDQTAPTLIDVTKDSDTQLTLTFSEIIQTNEGNPSDFSVVDDQGTVFVVSAQADGTALDDKIVLTVADLSTVNNDITVTYTNNNAEVRDFGSNDLATDNVGLNLDFVAPAAPTVTGITEDNGVSSSDGITNDNTLIFTGTAEANSIVELFTDGVSTTTTTTDGAGDFSFDFTGTTANDGIYSLTVNATDATGNTSPTSQAFALTIDTTVPTVTSLFRNQSGKLGSEVTSAEFAIVFIEPVSGIDAADFELITTGTATGLVGTVTVVSVNEAIIEVTGISGEGTIGLNLKDDDSIEDTAGNPLGGSGLANGDFTGEVYETKASQTVIFNDPTGTYGDVITLSATASSGLSVSFLHVSGPATLSGDQLTITGVGAIEVEASQSGDADFNAATEVSKTFTAGKASLTTVADDQSITFGDAIPSLTISYSGFVGADGIVDLDTAPAATTAATATSDAGNYPITASGGNDDNYSFSYTDGTLTIGQASQIVTLDAIADIDLASTNTVSLVATASSGLAVDFALTQGDGSINGTTLTANTTGIFTVEATQSGNSNYATATPVTQTFNVNDSRKTDQTITFAALDDKAYGDAPFALSASASSSLPVTFTATGPVTLDGSDLTITGAGLVTVTASQAGDGTFNPAIAVAQDFAVTNAQLTVTANDKSSTYGDASPTLDGTITGLVNGDNITATYATTALQTSDAGAYTITPTLVDPDSRLVHYDLTNTDGELTIAKADLSASANDKTIEFGEAPPTFDGTLSGIVNGDNITVAYSSTAVAGSDVGDYDIDITLVDPDGKLSNYNESIQVGVLSIVKADQTILFDPISNVDLATATTVNLVANTSSGLAISYTVTNGDGTISGSVLTINATGNFIVEATQSGNDNFNAATPVTQSFQVNDSRKMDQTITFASIADQEYGEQLTLGATASSNLAVTYALAAGIGSITNGVLTIEDVGSYTITASQVGDTDFNPAIDITQSFTVTKANLTVTAEDHMIDEGSAIPTLTFSYSGFKLTDELSNIDTPPTVSTSATAQSMPGDYSIALTGGDDNHYSFSLVDGTLTIEEVLGLVGDLSIQVYPNPTADKIRVDGDHVASIQLIDLSGKTVMSTEQKQLDLSSFSSGTYLVIVKDNKGLVLAERRIIKE